MRAIKTGRNGFKYNFSNVLYHKKRDKYHAVTEKKYLGTYEYATEAAKACDDYLIAINGDKTKLNFTSESEYLLALDEEKNTKFT